MEPRTVERTQRVVLAADVARCEPSQHCPMRTHCARYVAALPPSRALMMDGTLDARWSPAGCPHYMPAVDHMRCQYIGAERRAKPWPAVEWAQRCGGVVS